MAKEILFSDGMRERSIKEDQYINKRGSNVLNNIPTPITSHEKLLLTFYKTY